MLQHGSINAEHIEPTSHIGTELAEKLAGMNEAAASLSDPPLAFVTRRLWLAFYVAVKLSVASISNAASRYRVFADARSTADRWDAAHGFIAGVLSALSMAALDWAGPLVTSHLWFLAVPAAACVVYVGSRAENASTSSSERFYFRAMACALTAIATVSWSTIENDIHINPTSPTHLGSLSRDELVKTSLTLQFTAEDWLAPAGSLGSGAVLTEGGNNLYIVTNRHVLGLDQLASRVFQRKVHQFSGKAIFHNGKSVPISKFAIVDRELDLAIVEVDATGLRQGVDYIHLPIPDSPAYRAGDAVMAVGSPSGLEHTHTRGSVSALRQIDGPSRRIMLVQTDAAINPGNSGGPLFWDKGDRYYWIGINTAHVAGATGLGFAIDHREALSADWQWFSSDSYGVSQALDLIR